MDSESLTGASRPRFRSSVPIRHISVVNKSARVSDSDVAKMVMAFQIQLTSHAIVYYGPVPHVEQVSKTATLNPTSFPIVLLDRADVPDAGGYHEWNIGKVFIDPILDNGGTVLKGSNSVSGCLSHEGLEAIGDGPTNMWCDGPNGLDYARELCDAVESDSYDVKLSDGTDVAMSNFVLPDFFNPHATSMFDFLGKLRKPFGMTSGGYQITRTEPGKESQVFGLVHADAHTVEIGPRVHIHFGPDFPEWKKSSKIAKATNKRGKR